MNEYFCTWCFAPSHKPAVDELVICPECGTAGCMTRAELERNQTIEEMRAAFLEIEHV